MQPRPSPGSPPGSPPPPGLRRLAPWLPLATGVVVAALGAVLVLGGLLNLAGLAASGRPDGSGGTPGPGSTASAAPGSGAVGSSDGGSGGGSSAPAPSPSGDPMLVGAGNIAGCSWTDDEATAALVEQIQGIVFTLGDNAYESGTAAEFRNCYGPSWGRFLDRTAFAVAGNHDYLTQNGAPFRAYFGLAAVRDGATWFSQDVGKWHVVVLDANCGAAPGGCGPDSPEVQWLRADLAASSARCTLALWSQPRFSSGLQGSNPSVAPFWDALYAAGADLVVNGQDHDYERFAPQDASGRADPARGITEIVAGTGGAGLRDFGPSIANDVVRSSFAHGVLVLTLHPSGWSFQFVSTDGSFSDQGQGTCH